MQTRTDQADADPTRVASGFPRPEQVPGPTERLRELHGEEAEGPRPPRFGRVSVERAGSGDQASAREVVRAETTGGGGVAAPLTDIGQRVAEEAAARVREEIERAGLPRKARRTATGLGELGIAGVAGLGAIGALTTCFVAALALAVPLWASALIVAVAYAVPAAVLAAGGRNELKEGIRPDDLAPSGR